MKLGWSDVTPEAVWLNRRNFMAGAAALAATPALALGGKPSALSTDAKPNSFEEITNYNNFYEFGFGKEDPARYAGALTTDPWSVEIGGMVDRPGSYGVEDLPPNRRWRSGSIVCAASRPGRWSSPGWGCRWPRC